MAGDLTPARGSSELEILRQQFAPNAGDEELAYFAKVSNHLALDPWAGHICLMEIGGAHRPTITVAGRRFIADRTGRLRGIVGPEWRGRTIVLEDGTKDRPPYEEDWEPEDPEADPYPYAARCLVLRSDWDRPANGTALWSEFSRWTKRWEDRKTGEVTEPHLFETWARMPSHMLGKVAESMALRRAFPEVQAAISYVGGTDEDSTLLREVEAEGYVLASSSAGGSESAVGEVRAAPPARARGPERDPDPERRPRRSRWENDRVPDHVYDALPEANQ